MGRLNYKKVFFRTNFKYGILAIPEDIKKQITDMPPVLEVAVAPYKQNRSNEQNRYYWGVVVRELADHTGYAEEEMHEILKALFLNREKTIPLKNGNKTIFIAESTTRLKTNEMEDYLRNIREWASAELGCYLPEPSEALNG